ncbi:MAG TPA: DUF4199 domain-containing protein [Tahibacter sp.]|uniref:DUF4199 domain-containing protein n=1 Tax=Tahibacter sp. TaxID=2056211 RepID=UPI002B8B868B|nr:DUF4199 domain-containing protein [Tahibacter sp.]HSX60630.1 DUF4199 domain-containing protein [Tahibacter sp.]
MLRKILSYGALAGLIAGGSLSAIAITLADKGMLEYGEVFGYLTMLIALSAIFVAIKRHRDQTLGGVIRFWPAFGLGLGISFVASLFYMLSWELAVAVTRVDFATSYSDFLIEQEKAKGASTEALAKLKADMDSFKVLYANPLFRLPMTFLEIFPVGLLVSLVSAGLLRIRAFLPAR